MCQQPVLPLGLHFHQISTGPFTLLLAGRELLLLLPAATRGIVPGLDPFTGVIQLLYEQIGHCHDARMA